MRASECALGVLVLLAACGGNAFTAATGGDAGRGSGSSSGSSGAADSGGRTDGAQQDAAGGGEGGSSIEGGSASPGVVCGPAKTCSGTTPVCCAGSTFECAHVQCGCTTQVECASNADCGGLAPFCCIGRRAPDATCGTSHFVARCDTACVNGALQMCDPNTSTDSCINAQCSSDSGDLANEGLPANAGYGVCK